MAKKLCVLLTTGNRDNGTMATLAFSLGLSALSYGHEVIVYMTGDGVLWGFENQAAKVRLPSFPALENLIQDFLKMRGKVLMCSICSQTCPVKGVPRKSVQVSGFASLIPFIMDGSCQSVTF